MVFIRLSLEPASIVLNSTEAYSELHRCGVPVLEEVLLDYTALPVASLRPQLPRQRVEM